MATDHRKADVSTDYIYLSLTLVWKGNFICLSLEINKVFSKIDDDIPDLSLALLFAQYNATACDLFLWC